MAEIGIKYVPPYITTWRNEGRLVVPGVFHRDAIKTYSLFDNMTPAMNQEQLNEFHERERQAGNPYPANAQEVWAIAQRGYELRSTEAGERLRDVLRAAFRNWVNTSTGIDYSPEGDSVLHNVGVSDQYALKGNIVGPVDWIAQIPDKQVLKRIIGTQDIQQINRVSNWINGTDFYLWRESLRPVQLEKRAVRFDAGDYGLGLCCDGGPLDGAPAFRVSAD